MLFVASLRVSQAPSLTGGGGDPSLQGDPALFIAVVDRMALGETYYPAMNAELRSRRYPTASVFNWRTPVLYTALATVPGWMRRVVGALLFVAVIAAALPNLARSASSASTVLGAIALAVAAAPLLSSAGRSMTEPWAGLLIGLSLCAYARSAWLLAAAIGVAALFIRELTAPYCVVCAIFALRARRWQEIGLWATGLVLFVIYYAAHVHNVWAYVQPGDLAHPRPWIQFGGLPFWLATLKTNGALTSAPTVVLAAITAVLFVALWSPDLSAHVRWTVVAYAAFFVTIGQPFNGYWGFVPAIAQAFAIAHAPTAFAWLVGSVERPSRTTAPRG